MSGRALRPERALAINLSVLAGDPPTPRSSSWFGYFLAFLACRFSFSVF
jgi:hypothetical protein